ncbi:MAG: hypothetical protein ACFE7R_00195 [Candidatus Hodarchaeota archaeon]
MGFEDVVGVKEMQLLVQDASELVMAVTLMIAAVILFQYTRERTADLPAEEKSAGYPLYLSVLGIVTMAIASSINYNVDLNTVAPIWSATYYAMTMIAAGFFSIAALMILEWRRAFIIPILLLAVSLIFTYSIVILDLSVSFGFVVGPPTLILNLIPIFLFLYLVRKTGRITAVALAFLLISYIIYPIASTATDPSLIAAILGIRLLGPALAAIAFYKPELGVSIELFGYALSINIVAFFFSYALVFVTANFALMVAVSLIALLAVIGFATSTYTLTRYRERRNTATGFLAIYFLTGSVSYIVIALTSIQALTGDLNAYTSATLGFLAMMFINLSAFIALDWRRVLLLPILIVAPGLIYLFLNYPTPLNDIPMYGMVIGITNMVQNIVPIGLYAMLWHRMRKAEAPGSSRPLFLVLGLILLIIGSVIGVTPEGSITIVGILPASVLVLSYTTFWLGITGRADTLLGTTRLEV